MKEQVLIAMSGGVDSSVAARLLQEQGYSCHGVMMSLFSPPDAEKKEETDLRDAEKVAKQLGIPFSVVDCKAEFSHHVIDYFIKSYQNGLTPNPCIVCNRTMKFGHLLELAQKLGCEKIATGHYARIEKSEGGRYLLCRAADLSKDQSYVLWQLTQEQLAHTLFPLGELQKSEIRALAAASGFSNAERRDSQDICFIPDGDYIGFIQHMTGESFPEGDFVDLSGNVIGRHRGQLCYTVGQRKGLGIAFGKPTYVCAKDAKTNRVTLGDNADLFRREVTARQINLIATDRIDAPLRVLAKIRYAAAPAAATVEQTDPDTLRILFDEPQRAVCPGQSAVLYDGDVVIGGGVIE